MEEQLKKIAKQQIKHYIAILVLLVIIHICFSVFAIIKIINSDSVAERIILIFLMIAFVLQYMWEIFKNIIPCAKDAKHYKDNEVERMRAVIVRIKGIECWSYAVTAKNLETSEEVVFRFSSKTVDVNKIYDFWYLKHSLRYKYSPVSFEQLTEDNREKASKIDFNQKD
ncbi:MAG: hypothetical protein J6B45_01650 [Clostridia bacterium]|nr:hypothetical protein [Clostridia bacterium]